MSQPNWMLLCSFSWYQGWLHVQVSSCTFCTSFILRARWHSVSSSIQVKATAVVFRFVFLAKNASDKEIRSRQRIGRLAMETTSSNPVSQRDLWCLNQLHQCHSCGRSWQKNARMNFFSHLTMEPITGLAFCWDGDSAVAVMTVYRTFNHLLVVLAKSCIDTAN